MKLTREFEVVIPWRTDNGPRQKILDWILLRWEYQFPGINIHLFDSGDEIFSRSKSRNMILTRAKSTTTTIVFADADVIPFRSWIEEAVDQTYSTVYENSQDSWSIAYGLREYYNLNQYVSEAIVMSDPSGPLSAPCRGEYEHKLMSWAGMIAVPFWALLDVGGYDERFIGWGHEDVAFKIKLDNELAPHTRVESGRALHLWHPRPQAWFGDPHEQANAELFEREYRQKYNWVDERP